MHEHISMYTYKEMSENMCISQPICNRVGRALSRAKTANDQVVSKGKSIVLIMNEWSADPNSTAERPFPFTHQLLFWYTGSDSKSLDQLWSLMCKQASIYSRRYMQSSSSIQRSIWMAMVERKYDQFINNVGEIFF